MCVCLQVESQEGLVNLPLDNLLPVGQGGQEHRAETTSWSQKMRDAFSELASKANHAVGTATDTVSKVAQRTRALLACDLPWISANATEPPAFRA